MLNVSKGHFVSKPPEEPQAPGHITHSPVHRFITPPPKIPGPQKKKAPDQAANYRNTRTTTNKLAASRR